MKMWLRSGAAIYIGTALQETGSNFTFAFSSNGDLLAINKRDTATDSTEVSVINIKRYAVPEAIPATAST